MKKKINRRLAISLLMSFVIYMLFGQVTQLFQLQKSVVSESKIIIEQLAWIVEQTDSSDLEDESTWKEVLSHVAPDDKAEVLIADASTKKVLGATAERFAGKTLESLGILPIEYQKFGKGFHVTIGENVYYGVFYRYDDLLYGRLKEQGEIYQPLHAPTILMPLISAILLMVLGIGISRYANDNLARPLTKLCTDIRRFTDGEKDVTFETGKTDFDEIRQIGSCMKQLQDRLTGLENRLDEHRHLLEAEAERADVATAAKRVFLSHMSHDIRKPLNGIIGMTSVAEEHISDENCVRDALAKIDASGKQLLSMLNDVLDMSMIESGRLDLTEENFQLADLINRTIADLRPKAEERQQQLLVEVKGLMHEHVVGSPMRVREIFTNIIENSVKYTPRGGMIRVKIAELPSEIRYAGKYLFVFEDNGIGMTPETVEHIFEPFEQASPDQGGGAPRGMGLGLPIVKNIVELMNGSIQVESEPGTGSKFSVIISLKLQKRAEGVATRMVRNEIHPEDFRKENYADKRILVVEDDTSNDETTAQMMAMAGIEFEQACGGQQAVLRMTEVPEGYFDLILMDIQMPVMDVYIATRMIRNMKREDVKRLPIIAMTLSSSGEERETARQAGVDGYISKPLVFERLKEILMKWL